MTTAVQHSMFGGVAIAGTILDKMTYVLEKYPRARESYQYAAFFYWLEFDGLGEILGDQALCDRFARWLDRDATSFKTLQNRAMEIQNDRPDLEAPREVERIRQRQSRAGRIVR